MNIDLSYESTYLSHEYVLGEITCCEFSAYCFTICHPNYCSTDYCALLKFRYSEEIFSDF